MRFKEIRFTPWGIKAHRCQIKGAFSNRPIANWILSYFGLWFENLKSDYHCCKDGLGSASVAIKGKKGCCFGRIYDLEKYTCFFDGGMFYITDLRTMAWGQPGGLTIQRPSIDLESSSSKLWNKTLKELREIIPDYMTEWDYEPPNSRSYAKLGLLDDYQWVFQSRMKSRKEWHEKQELRKQLNEDFKPWGQKALNLTICLPTPASTNNLYLN